MGSLPYGIIYGSGLEVEGLWIENLPTHENQLHKNMVNEMETGPKRERERKREREIERESPRPQTQNPKPHTYFFIVVRG